MPEISNFDDFDGGELGNWYYSPRQMPSTFANATERPAGCVFAVKNRLPR